MPECAAHDYEIFSSQRSRHSYHLSGRATILLFHIEIKLPGRKIRGVKVLSEANMLPVSIPGCGSLIEIGHLLQFPRHAVVGRVKEGNILAGGPRHGVIASCGHTGMGDGHS